MSPAFIMVKWRLNYDNYWHLWVEFHLPVSDHVIRTSDGELAGPEELEDKFKFKMSLMTKILLMSDVVLKAMKC